MTEIDLRRWFLTPFCLFILCAAPSQKMRARVTRDSTICAKNSTFGYFDGTNPIPRLWLPAKQFFFANVQIFHQAFPWLILIFLWFCMILTPLYLTIYTFGSFFVIIMQRTFAYSIERATQKNFTGLWYGIVYAKRQWAILSSSYQISFALFSWFNRLQLYNNLIRMFKAVRFSFSLRSAWSPLCSKSQLSNKSENLTGFIADCIYMGPLINRMFQGTFNLIPRR